MEGIVPEYIDSNVSSTVYEGLAYPQPLPIRRPPKQSFIKSQLHQLYCDIGKAHLNYLKETECEICYENNIEVMLFVCHHSMCKKCITKIKKHQNRNCPYCRRSIDNKNISVYI
tara:strand:+ start:46 stop:387 length:342 start_codon:yes stop_codon:yes gene_type:complete